MDSLLIWGFPRSMTSLTYEVLAQSLSHQLKLPEEKYRKSTVPLNGEVLNRTTLMPPTENGSIGNEEAYLAGSKVLDMFRGGYLIKDVVQPWIVWRYLKENPGAYKVLFIERPLADILSRMHWHFWSFPMRAGCSIHAENGCADPCVNCTQHPEPYRVLAEGIVEWDKRFFRPKWRHDAVVQWDDLIWDEEVLFGAVEGIGYQPKRFPWMRPGFENTRKIVLAYRLDDHWKKGQELIEGIQRKFLHPSS